MASESRVAIYVGIGATLLIAAIKFAAALASGSSAMAAEGVHSLVDSSNGLLLLLGLRRAVRPADDAHPLGHGREIYFWSLIVALMFFALGSGISFYEGIHQIRQPAPVTDPTWNYVVLGASAVFTLVSFVVSFRAFHRRAGTQSLWQSFRESKDPTIFTLVLEDLADLAGLALAFLGVYLSRRLHVPALDGVASVGIGVVMTVVAILLARESKSLLVGEGATRDDRNAIRNAASECEDIDGVTKVVTQYLGPDTMLVLMHVAFSEPLAAGSLAAAVERLKARVRAVRPSVRYIYIEAESLEERARGTNPGQTGTA